jgi:hypothetical protein
LLFKTAPAIPITNADLPTFGKAEIKFQLSYISISPHTIESSVISISVSPLTGSGIPSF